MTIPTDSQLDDLLRASMQELTRDIDPDRARERAILSGSSRRRLVLGRPALSIAGVAAVLAVVVAVVSVIAVDGGGRSHHRPPVAVVLPSAEPSPAPTDIQPTPESVPDTSGIPGVKGWKYEVPGAGTTGTIGAIQATHDAPGTVVQYFTYPPVGGPHVLQWLTCGEYAETPAWEHAVHNLEHGAVIITYRPDVSSADKAALDALLRAQTTVTLNIAGQSVDTKQRYVDLWPFAGQSSPIVLSSWGHQLDVTSASDPRIQRFIDAFRDKSDVTPEYGASCGPFTDDPYGTPEPGTN